MCPALEQSESDLQKVLYSCYQLLKSNDGIMTIGDLQVEYLEMVGRNLARVAAAYRCKSVATFLEMCRDIRIVVDDELKEVFAEVMVGDMEKSSFREVNQIKVIEFFVLQNQEWLESISYISLL